MNKEKLKLLLVLSIGFLVPFGLKAEFYGKPYKAQILISKIQPIESIENSCSIEVSEFKLFFKGKRRSYLKVKEVVLPLEDIEIIEEYNQSDFKNPIEFNLTEEQANRIVCVTSSGKRIFLADYGQTNWIKLGNKIYRNRVTTALIGAGSVIGATLFTLGTIVVANGINQTPKWKTYSDKRAEVDSSGNPKYGKFGAAWEQIKDAFAKPTVVPAPAGAPAPAIAVPPAALPAVVGAPVAAVPVPGPAPVGIPAAVVSPVGAAPAVAASAAVSGPAGAVASVSPPRRSIGTKIKNTLSAVRRGGSPYDAWAGRPSPSSTRGAGRASAPVPVPIADTQQSTLVTPGVPAAAPPLVAPAPLIPGPVPGVTAAAATPAVVTPVEAAPAVAASAPVSGPALPDVSVSPRRS